MSYQRLSVLAIIVAFTACITEPVETNSSEHSSSSGQFGPYPASAPSAKGVNNPPSWKCGYEIITVKGPGGEIIRQEIPLECDPFADVYFGDPAPIMTQENQIKKAPYETGPDLNK